MDYLIGITIHHNVCIMRGKYHLSLAFQSTKSREDCFEQELLVDFVFGLVDDQRSRVVSFKNKGKKDADLGTAGCCLQRSFHQRVTPWLRSSRNHLSSLL